MNRGSEYWGLKLYAGMVVGEGKRGSGGRLTNMKDACKSLPETHFFIHAFKTQTKRYIKGPERR